MNDRFLKACRREPVDATPIWLMRQAGRYMAEYRKIRERHSMLEMVKTPELAAEITLQPVRAFGVDAAIIFADILTLLDSMGLKLDFVRGHGPSFENPVRSEADIEALRRVAPEEGLGYTLKAIAMVKQNLAGLPLIGFSGAPFTLACYAIEGGGSKDFVRAKSLMYGHPRAWRRLMEKIADAVGAYLRAQAAAGADALQLFDSWVGALSPADYLEYAFPYSRRALQIAQEGALAPLIHFGAGTAGILPLLRRAGGDVIGVDWRIDLASAWDALGPDVAVQGNLDPVVLFGPADQVRRQAARILDSVRGRSGHIFNLGHGILEHTPVENVAALVDFVHEYSAGGRR